jgi:streptogramin lyase
VKIIAATLVAALAGAVPLKTDVGEWSYGLASSGGSVWVGGLGGSDVLRLDPRTGKVTARVPVGPRVFNLAAAPGAVWAVSNIGGSVTRIDTAAGRAARTIRVGYAPYDVAWGFGSAWVTNAGDGTVSRITRDHVVKTIKVGIEPNGLASYDGAVWVSDHTAGKLLRIDPATNRVTGAVALAGADWVVGRGSSLYVSQETNVVSRVDVRTLKVTGRAKVDRNPLGAAFVGAKLWVPCIDAGTIDVVDPVSLRVVARRSGGPGPIVVLPGFGHTWVSHSTGNAVWRL